ncbi:MAG: hypothetical protein IJH34_12285, partial [Romboutsia sp.]|nr:hypothetical protein [Romboutsia sp.]
QKNYVIDVAVAEGVKKLAEEFDVKESRMIEEMYYTFMELLEKGKEESKKENKRSTRGKKEETKAEDKEDK